MDSADARGKVFISYSRFDTDFADEITLALSDKGFEPLLDRKDIDSAEKWRDRLETLIASCDTVVFLVTKNSAQSKICSWEVDEAAKQGKRMIPVLPFPLGNFEVPARLADLNYIHFYKDPKIPGSGFYDGVIKLERALSIDLEWLRQQTRLTERAREWAWTGSHDRLLRGDALGEAVKWLDRTPAGVTVDPKLRAFLDKSEQAERLRLAEVANRIKEREEALRKLSRRTMMGLGAAGVLTAAAGGLAWWGNDAERRFRLARARAVAAEAQSIERAIAAAAARTDLLGQILAYAAAPGEIALDGEVGGTSPYTNAVVNALQDRDTSVIQGLLQAGEGVRVRTHGIQRPYLSTDINGGLYIQRQDAVWRKKALCISVDGLADGGKRPTNVHRDADLWTDFLRRCGFEVQTIQNPTSKQFTRALDDLTTFSPLSAAAGAATADPSMPGAIIQDRQPTTFAAVVYSGIGFEKDGWAALGFADTQIIDGEEVPTLTNDVGLRKIQQQLRTRAALSLFVIDTNFKSLKKA